MSLNPEEKKHLETLKENWEKTIVEKLFRNTRREKNDSKPPLVKRLKGFIRR